MPLGYVVVDSPPAASARSEDGTDHWTGERSGYRAVMAGGVGRLLAHLAIPAPETAVKRSGPVPRYPR